MDILRADKIGILDQTLVVGRILQILMADAPKLVGVVHLCDLAFVSHQIIVEIVGRAMVQAAGVGQHVQAFSVFFAPGTEPRHRFQTAVVFPLHVVTVKIPGQIIHALYGADLHIHRCAGCNIREVILYKLCDQR